MLSINALRSLKHYLPQGFNELRTKVISKVSQRFHLRDHIFKTTMRNEIYSTKYIHMFYYMNIQVLKHNI
jgi:hypothetical protein